jgi:hypothetical protein
MKNITNVITSPYGHIDSKFNEAYHKIDNVYQLLKSYELIDKINIINTNTTSINNVSNNITPIISVGNNISSIIGVSLKLTILQSIYDNLNSILFFNGNHINALEYLGLTGISNNNDTLKKMFEDVITGKKNFIANNVSINNPDSSTNSSLQLKTSTNVIKGFVLLDEANDKLRITKTDGTTVTSAIDLYNDRIEINGTRLYINNGDLGSAVDLNDIIIDGYYNQNNNSDAISGNNYPVDLAGTLSVKADGSIIYQTYQTYNSSGTYYRSKYNGTWYTWRKLFDTGNDGTGSSLNADTLDGYDAASFRNASLLATGTVPNAVLPLIITSDITGTAANATLFNNQNSSYYKNATNLNDGTLANARLSTDVVKMNGEIGGSVNLNSYQTTGYYKQSTNADAQTGTNYPNAVAGILLVINAGNIIYQQYQEYDGTDLHFRSSYNGSWFSWKKVIHTSNDGSGSGLDADLLDGQSSAYYRNPANLTGGIVPDAVLPSLITADITGSAVKLNGQLAAYYNNATNLNTGTIPGARLPVKQSWTPTNVDSYVSTDCVYVDLGSCIVLSFNVALSSTNKINNLPYTAENRVPFIVHRATADVQGSFEGQAFFAQVSGNSIQINTNDDGNYQGTVTLIKN